MLFLIFVANMSIFVAAVAPITYYTAVVVLVVGHGLVVAAQELFGIAVAVPHAYWRLSLQASLLQFQLFLTHIPAGFFPLEIPTSSFFIATFLLYFHSFLFCVFPKVSMAKFRTSLPACLS